MQRPRSPESADGNNSGAKGRRTESQRTPPATAPGTPPSEEQHNSPPVPETVHATTTAAPQNDAYSFTVRIGGNVVDVPRGRFRLLDMFEEGQSSRTTSAGVLDVDELLRDQPRRHAWLSAALAVNGTECSWSATLDEVSELLEQLEFFQCTNPWNSAMEHVAKESNVGMLRGAAAVRACQYRFGDTWVIRRAAVIDTQFVTSLDRRLSWVQVTDADLAAFRHLRVLKLGWNDNEVTTVAPFASTLRELDTCSACGIDDAGLSAVTALEVLKVGHHRKVTTVKPFASTLRELEAYGTATALEVLDVSDNPKVTTVAPFAWTLSVLDACGESGIDDASLAVAYALQLLDVRNNPNVTTVAPFASMLRFLVAGGACGIDDAGLQHATALEVLDVSDNPKVTTVAPFAATLRRLTAGGACGIDDAGLAAATVLEKLDVSDNPRVTTVASFASTLRELAARGRCGVDDAALVAATALEVLDVSDNANVTTLAPFASTLSELKAEGNSGIDDAAVSAAKMLRRLQVKNNGKVTRQL